MICAFAFAKMCGFNLDTLDKPNLTFSAANLNKYNAFKAKYLVDITRLKKSNGEILLEALNAIEKNKIFGGMYDY